MKAFYIIIVTFALTVALVFAVGVKTSKVINLAIEELEAAEFSSKECAETIESGTGRLLANLDAIEFSIHHKKRDELEEAVTILRLRSRGENQALFEEARALLIDVLRDILESERPKLRSVI